MQTQKKPMTGSPAQRVDKPSHSVSGLRAGAHECHNSLRASARPS